MKSRTIINAALLFALVSVVCTGCSLPFCKQQHVIEKNVTIPMRDGVVLKADVRRPKPEGRHPVLVFRTPYSKDEGDYCNEQTFNAALQRGYAVVIQDVRGRFQSEGEFIPYQNEGRDGYDTIEWAARQPWSDGRIGTFGLSYPGAVQWLAAIENPPHLKAMVPAMCVSSMDQGVYFGGVFAATWANWAYRFMSPDLRTRLDLPGPRTEEAANAQWIALGGAEAFQGWLPAQEMPYLKDSSPYYYTWLQHPPYDSWWDWGNLHDKYPRVQAAVLNLSGWYDDAYGSEGAITNYLGIVNSRKGESDPRAGLILGPWIHGVDATGSTTAGDRKFAETARIDYDKVVLDWLDRYVKGAGEGTPAAAPVQVYSMGKDRWLHSQAWPLKETRPTDYYLGGWSASPAGFFSLGPGRWKGDGSAAFVSDPGAPVRDTLETDFGAFDLRSLGNREDVLTFETDPFAEDLEVVGHVGAEIYASSDAPDFDLYVKLLDVAPDGTAFNLETPGHEVLRASYRDMTAEQKLLKPGEVVKLTYRNMMTGNTFLKGHRLRVCLMASWYPTFSRNLQTGHLESVSSAYRKARITIHYGSRHQTKLILPVIAGQ